MSPLTDDQKQQFIHEGFLLFDPQIPESVIDGAVADLDSRYERVFNGAGHLEPCRLQDAWQYSQNAHAIAVWPSIVEALRELYGRQPLPFQTLNFPTGTIQPAHSDSVHFSSAPGSFMSGVWVGLEDIDEANGPVFYYPGSHNLPAFDMSDVGVEPLEENYAHYEQFIAGVVEHFGLVKKQATMKKGQAFIWAANLIHGGDQRTDLFRSRHSQVTHVYYEGCKFFTPMMSRGLDICWRDPEFLPLELPAGMTP
jgi:ectoine hydroxylase-related dioxygenase (phytanoyl-CoA dioxygenase family)